MLDQLLSNQFMPHGHCYYWQPGLLWTHVGSDAAIALAYFAIPVCLAYFLRQRPGQRFAWVAWLFAAFIVLCGITHVFGIVTIWDPVYPMEAAFKVACAAVSVFTAFVLIPLIPRALTLRSAEELEAINARLQAEVAARRRAESELSSKVIELEQSNRELEQFAYVASHDLQSPLRTVVSFTELLDKKLGPERDAETAEYMGFITESGRRMQTLIRDLLELSRINTRAQPLQPVAADRALDDALKLLSGDIEASGARIRRESLPEVRGDASQLAQLFQNLLANAIKFQPPGGQPRIEISAVAEGPDWRFCIADNGIGIDDNKLEEIFTIFRRMHSDDEYSGSGIGLAICQKIVSRHGGRIWAERGEQGGTRFLFTLRDAREVSDQRSPADGLEGPWQPGPATP